MSCLFFETGCMILQWTGQMFYSQNSNSALFSNSTLLTFSITTTTKPKLLHYCMRSADNVLTMQDLEEPWAVSWPLVRVIREEADEIRVRGSRPSSALFNAASPGHLTFTLNMFRQKGVQNGQNTISLNLLKHITTILGEVLYISKYLGQKISNFYD